MFPLVLIIKWFPLYHPGKEKRDSGTNIRKHLTKILLLYCNNIVRYKNTLYPVSRTEFHQGKAVIKQAAVMGQNVAHRPGNCLLRL